VINGESADEVRSHYVTSRHCDDAMCVVSKDKTHRQHHSRVYTGCPVWYEKSDQLHTVEIVNTTVAVTFDVQVHLTCHRVWQHT